MRDTAPFIWTTKQPIDFMKMIALIKGDFARDRAINQWFLFRKEITLDEAISEAPLHITVDGRYQLFVNGARAGRGPARCSPVFQRYDTYDVSSFLKPGPNVIAVIVHVFGTDMSWYEKVEGLWNPIFGDGGLWISGSAGSISLSTDLGWKCLHSDAWVSDTPPSNLGLDFIELLDANKLPQGWMEPGFDDGAWDDVQIMQIGGGGPEAFFGGLIMKPFPHLVPNRLKPLAEKTVAPERVVWTREANPATGVPFYDEFYKATLAPSGSGFAHNLDHALEDDERVAFVQTSDGKAVTALFDFGHLTTLHPVIEIDANGGEIIDIAVCEKLPGEWDDSGIAEDCQIGRSAADLDIGDLLGLDAHFTRYIARAGKQRFERFSWQAAKWMQIMVRNADQGLSIRFVGGTNVNYPAEPQGMFTSSDPMLDRLWTAGANTVQACMHDGWEDCPSREQRQWLGDATVEHLAARAAFGSSINELNAEFLRKAAESQRPDGLTQMYAPGNHGTNGVLIPDWTLQWILNARDHLRFTGDLDLLDEILPSILKALGWFERLIDENGLAANVPYWHFMDHAGVGRELEACTLNAQLAGCFGAAAEIASALEMPRLAKKLTAQMQSIQTALNKRHWDSARGVYVDCVDPATHEHAKRVSQHANAAMILWGGAPEDRWASMIDWITDPSRITFTACHPLITEAETLDEDTGVVRANTFYGHFVLEALKQAGRMDLVLSTIRQNYGEMMDKGATTLWESFSMTELSSVSHGFSASPTWQFSTGILGVRPAADCSIQLSPDLVYLDRASGTVPVHGGFITAKLERQDGNIVAQYDLKTDATIACVPPAGFDLVDLAHTQGQSVSFRLVPACSHQHRT